MRSISEARFTDELRAWADEINELQASACYQSDSFERLSAELDRLCAYILHEDNGRLWNHLEDRMATDAAAYMRHCSAMALGTLEKARVRKICSRHRDRCLYAELLSASLREERNQVEVPRDAKVMFVGAGAFPASAFTLAEAVSTEVLCVDIDEEAIRYGTELARHLGLDATIRYVKSHLGDLRFAADATHIFIASLVPEKLDILRELRPIVRPGCRFIVRYGNGLKSLFNYPLAIDTLKGWRVRALDRAGSIYDTIVLEADD
ncbi:hypothetical protein GXP70_07675 [Paenibacillus lycopersici]|uniref:Methyltransferase domain-containing protein n=1 Tax=Paenibacillus lycopersici TaxID=2704462 RepID=A0A6C0G017_9BACL|nr:nicotianamine synthase family protein [Paenibacillus lycopersici]QHT59840.1 hypothetical protein GXP70_07675 [Paenibacillus lycopersici]